MREILSQSFNTEGEIEQRVVLLEDQVRDLTLTLKRFFLQGRLRTDRVAPMNSTDVVGGDMLYDRVVTADSEYILVNNEGMPIPALEWRQITLNIF